MAGTYVIKSFSGNGLRAYQYFCRQFGKIFIQAELLRIDQWSFFSPETGRPNCLAYLRKNERGLSMKRPSSSSSCSSSESIGWLDFDEHEADLVPAEME